MSDEALLKREEAERDQCLTLKILRKPHLTLEEKKQEARKKLSKRGYVEFLEKLELKEKGKAKLRIHQISDMDEFLSKHDLENIFNQYRNRGGFSENKYRIILKLIYWWENTKFSNEKLKKEELKYEAKKLLEMC